MLISGQETIKLKLVQNLQDTSLQIQPGAIDLTVKKIGVWKNAGVIDAKKSENAQVFALPYKDTVYLKPSTYYIEFNETVKLPSDISAFILSGGLLLNFGATVEGKLIEPGYDGTISAALTVHNPNGLVLSKNAKVAACIFVRS